LRFGGIELDHDIAFLHLRAVGGDLENLQISGVGGRGHGDGFHGLQLAAKLENIQKFTALDLKGSNGRGLGGEMCHPVNGRTRAGQE
jgi:hypothetical protein